MSGPGSGNPAAGLAVVTEVRGKGQRGDVVLSRGSSHGDELAPKDKSRRARQQPFVAVQGLTTETTDNAEQVQQRDTVEQLYKAIHQLPKTDAALVLLYLDELSYREMAEVLGISESNVGVKLNRAKKSLSALMNGQSHEH